MIKTLNKIHYYTTVDYDKHEIGVSIFTLVYSRRTFLIYFIVKTLSIDLLLVEINDLMF